MNRTHFAVLISALIVGMMPGESGAPAAYDREVTTPYYYSTRFDESLIRAEFSPTARCGYFRFTFPHGDASVVLANRQAGTLQKAANGVVAGEESVDGLSAYFYGEFNAPV